MKNILQNPEGKSNIKFKLIIFLIFTLIVTTFSQIDTLICGKQYDLKTNNGWESKVILINYDSSIVTVRFRYKIFQLEKSEIEKLMLSNREFDEEDTEKTRIGDNSIIVLKGGNKIKNVTLETISNDTLIVSNCGEKFFLQIDSIDKIIILNKSYWGLYAFGGAIISGLATFVIFELSRPTVDKPEFFPGLSNSFYNITELYTAIGVGLAGGVLSGFIASQLGKDEIFDISHLNKQYKLNKIKKIIKGVE